MLKIILIIIFIVIPTWYILNESFYSPKERIKRLRKKVHKYSDVINKLHTDVYSIGEPYKIQRNKVGKVINSLLDYHFDQEEDKQYIEENRYTDEYTKHEDFIKKKIQSLLIQDEDWVKIENILNKK